MIEGFASPEEVKELRQRAEELVGSFNPDEVTVFSTKAQASAFAFAQPCLIRQSLTMSKHNGRLLHLGGAQVFNTNRYFLDSANTVSFFFEEKAFKDDGQTLQQAKALSINKIGHGDRAHA